MSESSLEFTIRGTDHAGPALELVRLAAIDLARRHRDLDDVIAEFGIDLDE